MAATIAFLTLDYNDEQNSPKLNQHTKALTSKDPVARRLRQLGHNVEFLPWEHWRTTDWSKYDLVYVHSTWNYYKDEASFRAFLKHCENTGVKMWNPPASQAWNIDKSVYLFDLARHNCRIPKTVVYRHGDAVSLKDLFALGSGTIPKEVVVKPSAWARADGVHRLHFPADADNQTCVDAVQAEVDVLLRDVPTVLVQEFLPEIAEFGEFSLMYIDGKFSHCIVKKPKRGEYRVQAVEFGGRVEGVPKSEVPPAVMALCEETMQVLQDEWPLLYTRFDIIPRFDGSALIMEVELIEPDMYWHHVEDGRTDEAIRKMADAIVKHLHA
jgi:glutathione synthase/RimK-type ligase-like ATP-grasp enzyme